MLILRTPPQKHKIENLIKTPVLFAFGHNIAVVPKGYLKVRVNLNSFIFIVTEDLRETFEVCSIQITV